MTNAGWTLEEELKQRAREEGRVWAAWFVTWQVDLLHVVDGRV